MRRSLLFIPGNNPAVLNNSDVFLADGVIFDLEDAVSVDEKDAARLLVSKYLAGIKKGKTELLVRINACDSTYLESDLAAIVMPSLDTIVVPKASVKELKKLDKLLQVLETIRGIQKPIGLLPIIESPQALLEVVSISKQNRVVGLLFGAEDYTASMEISRTKHGFEILYPRNVIAVACKAAFIDAIDTPFTDTLDVDSLKVDAQLAKSLGFVGKACIHPSQVEGMNEVFSPNIQEVYQARRVIQAFEEAKTSKLGVFSLDGKMIDEPVVKRARTLLSKAIQAGVWREES
jgi:citrate lyase subunit beta / citryl-CoA lyase